MPFIAIILFGILSSCFALILELIVAGAPFVSFVFTETLSFKILLILFGIAFIEETSKYIFLRQYASRFFTTSRAAIGSATILGASFGIGFAIPELFLIQYGMAEAPILALLGTASLHIATSIAFAIAILSFAKNRFSAPILVSAAMLLHTLYNLIILFWF